MNWIERLFSSSGFMPHGFCYTWDPKVIWLNGASDALIALAYYTIPGALVYFVRHRKDLAFHWMFLGFALFIVACGTTHVMELWSIWHPAYWLSGTIKAITAMASIGTAVALIRLVPNALALPGPEDLRKANLALLDAQQSLRNTNEELEHRVAERTRSLAAANAASRAEIEERKRTDERLRESERQLRTAISKSALPAMIFDEEGNIRLLSQGGPIAPAIRSKISRHSMNGLVKRMEKKAILPEPSSMSSLPSPIRSATENGLFRPKRVASAPGISTPRLLVGTNRTRGFCSVRRSTSPK
jgi:PAS domain-containing protein